jgi:hypothetical protein
MRQPHASLAAMPQHAAHVQAPRVSKDSRSALVTFQVPGNVTSIGQDAWQRRRSQAVKGGDPALVAAHP